MTQLFPALDEATIDELRSSIERDGVILPVVFDADGNLLDGNHRRTIAAELGIECPELHLDVAGAEAERIAADLNLLRRHLSRDQLREIHQRLRTRGLSLRDIAERTGMDPKTVAADARGVEGSTPETVRGRDGKSYPAKKPARDVVPGDVVEDDQGESREVAEVEDLGDEIILHDGGGDAVIVGAEKQVPISKPDLGGGISHPARYSDELIPIFVEMLQGATRLLDPFAGTGRIHLLAEPLSCETVGVELEPEWAALHPDTIEGDALDLPFADGEFDAICTSPTYGNRLADKHNASDPERRRSYTHDLGRDLSDNNSGGMQWGDEYRDFHEAAWGEAVRVLSAGGRFVLNIKDHIRGGKWQDVAGWHVDALCRRGLRVVAVRPVVTRHLRQGENAERRVDAELVVLFVKAGA